MPTKNDAIDIVDSFLKHGAANGFSGVALTALTLHKLLEEQFGTKLNAMPTCCHALEHRFQQGKDFFRRGKDRTGWSAGIDGKETSTFEVLFMFPR